MSKDIAIVPLWESAQTINATAAITSGAVSQYWSSGHLALLVVLTGSSPSVDITYQVGMSEGATFYTPVDRDGTGLGTLNSTVTSTVWISFSPVVAPFIKIVITGDGSNGADTGATAWIMYPEEF